MYIYNKSNKSKSILSTFMNYRYFTVNGYESYNTYCIRIYTMLNLRVVLLVSIIVDSMQVRYGNDCLRSSKLVVSEIPFKDKFEQLIKGDYLDYHSCSTIKSTFAEKDVDPTLPIQENYYCPNLIADFFKDDGYDPVNQTKWPHISYKASSPGCNLFTLESSIRSNTWQRVLRPNSKMVLFGDSLTRQLFIPLDCRLHANNLVKSRNILSTYRYK